MRRKSSPTTTAAGTKIRIADISDFLAIKLNTKNFDNPRVIIQLSDQYKKRLHVHQTQKTILLHTLSRNVLKWGVADNFIRNSTRGVIKKISDVPTTCNHILQHIGYCHCLNLDITIIINGIESFHQIFESYPPLFLNFIGIPDLMRNITAAQRAIKEEPVGGHFYDRIQNVKLYIYIYVHYIIF